MKILMVNWSWYPTGGDWTYIDNVKKLYEQHGHQVIPFSTQNPQNIITDADAYFIKVNDFKELNKTKSVKNGLKAVRSSIISYDALNMLDKILSEHKIDVAHLHNIHHYITPAIVWKLKKNGVKVIWTLHDYKIICPENSFVTHNQICERCIDGSFYNCATHRCKKNSVAASFLAAVEAYFYHSKKVYNQVDAFISPSEFLVDKFAQAGFSKNFYHLPNCYDVALVDDFIAKQKGAAPTTDYILYVGRMEHIKGVKTLLKAIKGTNITLKLAGTGVSLTEFKEYAKVNDIHNAHFLGFMNKQDVFELTYNARFVVCPSEWYENLPFSIVESLLFGKPVLGSNIGGIPELVVDNNTGCLFKAGDEQHLREKILLLWNDNYLCENIIKNCRKYIENLINFEKHWQKLEIIINKTLMK